MSKGIRNLKRALQPLADAGEALGDALENRLLRRPDGSMLLDSLGACWTVPSLADAVVCGAMELLLHKSLLNEQPWLTRFLLQSVSPAWLVPLRAALTLVGRIPGILQSDSLPTKGGARLLGAAGDSHAMEGMDGMDAVAERVQAAADQWSKERGRDDQSCALGETFYEHYLSLRASGKRIDHGVYYTPDALADFVVSQAHEAVVALGFENGLLDDSCWGDRAVAPATVDPRAPVVQILDPAAGDGAFLCSVLRHGRRMVERRGLAGQWPRTADSLLSRMHARELLPTPGLLGQLRVAWTLATTGYRPAPEPPTMQWSLGDTLASPEKIDEHAPPLVIVGNPPYRSATPMHGGWIEQLVRGKSFQDDPAAATSYHTVDGEPLGERKVWLQDAYIRFLRWAQWRLDRLGGGVAALVLNHGLFDNITFRGVREKLQAGFQAVDVVDLHGNIKAKERSPNGGPDDNLFDIATGVGVLVLRKDLPLDEGTDAPSPWMGILDSDLAGPPRRKARSPQGQGRVRRVDLWGSRDAKTDRLLAWSVGCEEPDWSTVDCRSPAYLFAHSRAMDPAYEQAPAITELMPVHSTAPVTARDGVVIDESRERLLARMRELADLSISDEVIRQRYFGRSRSRRYPQGDTRSWKLDEARRRLAQLQAERRLEEPIRRCLYRPFDWRYIYWVDWMVDWPRPKVTRHWCGDNVALIARRQMPPHQPCNFFWATRHIALDGVVRSDNRGSESLFPLWLRADDSSQSPLLQGGESSSGQDPTGADVRANLNAPVAQRICATAGLAYSEQPLPAGRRRDTSASWVDPQSLVEYVYGLFWDTDYRSRHAEHLRRDFPRVLSPASAERFYALAARGRRLLKLHTAPLESIECVESPKSTAGRARQGGEEWGEAVESDSTHLSFSWGGETWTTTEAAWAFAVGAYSPLPRWVKRNRHVSPSSAKRDELRALLGRLEAAVNEAP